jgi:AraC-type DNA-binding domain-containing proteins
LPIRTQIKEIGALNNLTAEHEIVQLNPQLPFKYYLHNENSSKTVAPHWHQSIELGFLVSQNELKCNDNNFTYHYHKGDIWVINSRNIHSAQLDTTKSLMEFCLIIDYKFLQQAYPKIEQIKFDLHGRPDSIKKLIAYQDLEKHLRMMIQLLQEPRTTGTTLELTGQTYLILANLIENFSYESPDQITEINDNLIDHALKLINSNYMADLNSNNLAKQLNTSITTLNRQFNQSVQMPINRYITTVRLLNAQKELLNTTKNIDLIAIDCGFSSTKSFVRNFKKWKGITPFHYRKVFH